MIEKLNGYTCLITSEADGHTFIAYVPKGQLPNERAFFTNYRDAVAAKKVLVGNGFQSCVARITIIMKTEPSRTRGHRRRDE